VITVIQQQEALQTLFFFTYIVMSATMHIMVNKDV